MLPEEVHPGIKPAGQRKGCLSEGGDRHVGVAWRGGTTQQTAAEFQRVAADATAGVVLEAHFRGGDIKADSHRLARILRPIFCHKSNATTRTLPGSP